jgi:hypothetical protein
MRKHFFISISLVALLSCNDHKKQQQQNVPDGLQKQETSYSLASKRGYRDIVERLYSELVEKTPALKKLEDDIDALKSSKDDSLDSFTTFDASNHEYYSSAQTHLTSIKDSLLRKKIQNLIQSSLASYNSLTAPHNRLLQSISSKESSLSDLHTALKIIRTLPVMEKYQKSNLPATNSLQGYANQVQKVINEAEQQVTKE